MGFGALPFILILSVLDCGPVVRSSNDSLINEPAKSRRRFLAGEIAYLKRSIANNRAELRETFRLRDEISPRAMTYEELISVGSTGPINGFSSKVLAKRRRLVMQIKVTLELLNEREWELLHAPSE